MGVARFVEEATLSDLAKAGGVLEVRISPAARAGYTASVLIRSTRERVFLSTTRLRNEPRLFRRVEVAIATMAKLVDAREFLVELSAR